MLPEGVPRTPEAEDASHLLIEIGDSKLLGDADFIEALARARRLHRNFDQESTVVFVEANTIKALDRTIEIWERDLRYGDSLLRFAPKRMIALLPLTAAERVPLILARFGDDLSKAGVKLAKVHCGVASAEVVSEVEDMNCFFKDLKPWGEPHVPAPPSR